MRLNVTLRRRVERAEKRNLHRKPLPTIIAAIHEAEMPGDVIGLEGNAVTVMRADLEPLDAFQARAATLIPSRFLKALYAAPSAARSDETAPDAITSAKAPEAAPWPVLGDAGVGAIAGRDQLIRMGAIAIPPERFV